MIKKILITQFQVKDQPQALEEKKRFRLINTLKNPTILQIANRKYLKMQKKIKWT